MRHHRRHRISSKKGRRYFARTASKVKKRNTAPTMRGGIRM